MSGPTRLVCHQAGTIENGVVLKFVVRSASARRILRIVKFDALFEIQAPSGGP